MALARQESIPLSPHYATYGKEVEEVELNVNTTHGWPQGEASRMTNELTEMATACHFEHVPSHSEFLR